MVGFYQPLQGQTSCLPCETGQVSLVSGATACSACPAGSSPAAGSASCIPCSPGTAFDDDSS
jgi:hypothetical protein